MKNIRIVKSDNEQLDAWINGEGTHWEVTPGRFDCCPDFSCCKPKLLQPLEVRIAFKNSSNDKRNKFLTMFLGGLISDYCPDVKYLIVGENESNRSS